MTSIRRVSLGLAALAFALLSTSVARADGPGDAWAVAKGLLPANPYVVMGMNIATIRGSTLFKELYPKLLAQSGEAKEGLDSIHTDCGIDVKEAIQGLVVAMDESNNGIVLVSTKGLDKGKIANCLTKVSAKEKKKVTAGAADAHGIVEYSVSGEKDRLYIAYLPKGVMAIATEPKDKSLLVKWLGGKGVSAGSTAGTALAKVNTGAAIWGVVNKAQQLEPGMNMKTGYGMADIAKGNISLELRLVLGSAKEASAAVTKANKQLADAKKGGQIPPALANVVKSVRITAAGTELQVRASMPETEALGLMNMAMGGGGH